jgi:hypothetical protein
MSVAERRMRVAAMVAVVVALAGCAARRPAQPPPPDESTAAQFLAARSFTQATRNAAVCDRTRGIRCGCDSASERRAAALRRARTVVERAKVARGSERDTLEREAGELLFRLQGY